jgi:hypothetical protein
LVVSFNELTFAKVKENRKRLRKKKINVLIDCLPDYFISQAKKIFIQQVLTDPTYLAPAHNYLASNAIGPRVDWADPLQQQSPLTYGLGRSIYNGVGQLGMALSQLRAVPWQVHAVQLDFYLIQLI